MSASVEQCLEVLASAGQRLNAHLNGLLTTGGSLMIEVSDPSSLGFSFGMLGSIVRDTFSPFKLNYTIRF